MYKHWLLAAFAAVVAQVPWAFAAVAPPIARTESGDISGSLEDNLLVFRGVPFAAPPVGALRWRPPTAVTPWTGTRKADEFAPACMQQGVSMPGEMPPRVSEDCLYLNIWTPAVGSNARLPVIVWIYGGGYTNGSASMPLYWGDRLAHKGVVLITIAYRLGPLGFLALPALTRESSDGSSGNYGLLDQVAALEWVHRNVAAFGGDPARVTIAGQSSGSISVSVLMSIPRARGLFQRAIGESGGLFEPLQLAPRYLLANAEQDGEKYLASLGVSSLEDLREVPSARLLTDRHASEVAHPVVGIPLLPLAPYDAFLAGRQNDVPLLVGSNAEEARSLTDVSHTRAATFDADIAGSFGPLPPAILAAYPHATDDAAREARLDLERDLRFGWDMWAWARLQATSGHNAVYYYSFRQRPPFPAGSVYEGWGASHFAELWYVFDHLNQAPWRWSASDRKLSKQMVGYWTNFARSGNPNGQGLPPWPAYTMKDSRVLYLGETTKSDAVPNLQTLTALDDVYDSVRGKPFGAR